MSAGKDIEQERAEFEKALLELYAGASFKRLYGVYVSSLVQTYRQLWQAARAACAQPAPVIIQQETCVSVCSGDCVLANFAGPDCDKHAAIFRDALAAQSSNTPRLTAHFSAAYIMMNVRRIVPEIYNKRTPNWSLATDVFAVGGTTGRKICIEAGIDPDGFSMNLAAPSQEGAPK